MKIFLQGFGHELLKLSAAIPQVDKQISGQNSEQKLDPSPVASADRNIGTSTPAGQPETPRGNPASTDIRPPQMAKSKMQQFKAVT
jgi:hypothetical protein